MSARSEGLYRPRAPGPLLQALELRAFAEIGTTLALLPLWGLGPAGDGHPVLVLPGLAAGDESTVVLRSFLAARGYAAYPWDHGVNLGLRTGVLGFVHQRLLALAHEHGRKVSLIGWSLGGIFARELAKQSPSVTRMVITLGSPFTGHPRETNAWRTYEYFTGHKIGAPEIHEPLRAPPPVPTTSIWSRTDGVVSWRCSIERSHEHAENIEVNASHVGLGMHPAVLFAIADRLAQPEGEWAPFRRDGLRALFYGDTRRL